MSGDILGVHHVTAITSYPQRNVNFYTGVLGLRLVKLTVNFDDPRSYYFREPGGILFEIATDPPGFTVDEPVEQHSVGGSSSSSGSHRSSALRSGWDGGGSRNGSVVAVADESGAGYDAGVGSVG